MSSSSSWLDKIAPIFKVVASTSFVTGAGMIAMALGLIPLASELVAVANVVILDRLGVTDPRLFLGLLGTVKMISVTALWIPDLSSLWVDVAVGHLTMSAVCGAYGHSKLSEQPQMYFALFYTLLLQLWHKQYTKSVMLKNIPATAAVEEAKTTKKKTGKKKKS